MAGDPILWRPFDEAPILREVAADLAADRRGRALSGLVAGARALLLQRLRTGGAGPFLLVVPDDTALDAYRRDLTAFTVLNGGDPAGIVPMPAMDADPYDGIAPHPEVVRERVNALGRIARGRVDILLVPARALLQPMPSPEEWARAFRVIRVGDTLPPERFVLQAMELGYRRVDIVAAPGEISRRGGIVDIFPPGAAEPVRVELFGDTIESMRAFDTDNQRSTGQLEEVEVGPSMECPPTDAALARLGDYLRQQLDKSADDPRAVRQLREQLEILGEQGVWPGYEGLGGLTAERPSSLFDHVEGLKLVVDEPELSEEDLLRADRDLRASYQQSGNRSLPPPARLFLDPAVIRNRMRGADLYLQELAGTTPEGASSMHHIATRRARRYEGRFQELAEELREAEGRGERVLCVMRAAGSAARLHEIFTEFDLESGRPQDPQLRGGRLIGVAALRSGFELPEFGMTLLAEQDLFGEERKSPARKGSKHAAFVSDFRDLKVGSIVVHVDHGIARYAGLGRPKGGSLNRDFMMLEFSGGDRLFVPADRLDLVQKYGGVAGKKPILDRLGGPGWERVKSKVRKAVESMAHELLDLYARRKAAKGHVFPPDTPWQQELESAFPHELTADQKQALEEIKSDMESGRALDRLLVGDVGYGKTEVAVRAAFKAVMDGFQVAVLAPTTVLAKQHFDTFRERYAPFPVRVEMVSRFRSAKEIKQVLADLEAGTVDVLIGTHRLLSKDVKFDKLGLLVVDEEQRFGVAHKERLKTMSIGIEVLSMTATPIPRTLQMSMAGVRDLSIIETPPPGRMAIQTYLVPFRKNVLAQAIRQEIRREGQIFFVHNKIETLPALHRAIAEMVPEARIVSAHGKMGERKLEQVMLDFVEHRADLLLTTTIIENGLDIPRANTIIINRADRFGLAQLYQLRGRVGRSRKHAFAYFVIPGRQHLSDESRKRLQALQEFSDLGAGFRLAAADLEIRGAGELLGARQSGHIASLGFDLYCQMLERAVQDLRGEPVVESKPVNLHLGVDVKIPESYLPESGDRLVIYKRIAQAHETAAVDRLQAETEDRYGHLPEQVARLFSMGRLRVLAEQAGIKSVDLIEDKVQVRFHDRPPIEPQQILDMLARERGSLSPSGMLQLPAPPRGTDRVQFVDRLIRAMLGRTAA